jgi:pimeloyl-ACP methyl ester carboxylesterase
MVNGIRIYYEVYGSGPPLLLIHGNGGSIRDWRCQIQRFSRSYRVVVTDSRAHGKSDDGDGALTYGQMAEDIAGVLKAARIGPVDIIGQSDGAILGLLLAIHHPAAVKKLVASGPNLRPDADVLADWFIPSTRQAAQTADAMLAKGDRSDAWQRIKRRNELMLNEPHIPVAALRSIQTPTLVTGGDDDAILPQHLLEIFRALPHAQLAIFPGATHIVFYEQPDTYNAVVERFLRLPFTRPTTKESFGLQ